MELDYLEVLIFGLHFLNAEITDLQHPPLGQGIEPELCVC